MKTFEAFKDKSVLIVDDDVSVRQALSEIIRVLGGTPTEAVDGAHGLELFESRPFDVVLTDFSMPRMNGGAMAQAMKAAAPTQRIIMVTALPELVCIGNQLPAGVDGLVCKPFRIRELVSAITEQLNSHIAEFRQASFLKPINDPT